MKKIYWAIQSRLVSLSKTEIKGNALKRINTLSGLVSGMIRKGSSHLPDIGNGLTQDINGESKTKAAKRFVPMLRDKWTDVEWHFLPFLQAFIQGILVFTNLSEGILIVVDGSQMGKANAVLMVSLVWRGRGIPPDASGLVCQRRGKRAF